MVEIVAGKKLDINEIAGKRKIAGVFTDKDGVTRLVPAEELAKFTSFLDKIHRNQDKDGTNLSESIVKGFSANKGIVRGVVKIVLSSKDFDKLQPGEILVTTMTSVDFVPVMERAAAFVTNEGGITSHASIVSREMGKPCIIGTKIATKILKDGDLVEVNADEGIVRVIKKANEK